MTASFAGRVHPPTGTAWTLVNGLALAAVAGFTVAGWAVFKTYSWWLTLALLSAVVGWSWPSRRAALPAAVDDAVFVPAPRTRRGPFRRRRHR